MIAASRRPARVRSLRKVSRTRFSSSGVGPLHVAVPRSLPSRARQIRCRLDLQFPIDETVQAGGADEGLQGGDPPRDRRMGQFSPAGEMGPVRLGPPAGRDAVAGQ